MKIIVFTITMLFSLSWQIVLANGKSGNWADWWLTTFLHASNEERVRMCRDDLPISTAFGAYNLQFSLEMCKGFMSETRYSLLKSMADERAKILDDLLAIPKYEDNSTE